MQTVSSAILRKLFYFHSICCVAIIVHYIEVLGHLHRSRRHQRLSLSLLLSLSHLRLSGLALNLLVEAEEELATVVRRETEHAEFVGEVPFRKDEKHVHL